jgi:hypothetical protein
MTVSMRVAPSNSLIGISDVEKGIAPDIDPKSSIVATESCILVACLPEVDGDTEITLGRAGDVDPGKTPAFDGQLATPTGNLQVVTVDWKPLLQIAVMGAKTRVRIWLNRPEFPDAVTIGVE